MGSLSDQPKGNVKARLVILWLSLVLAGVTGTAAGRLVAAQQPALAAMEVIGDGFVDGGQSEPDV